MYSLESDTKIHYPLSESTYPSAIGLPNFEMSYQNIRPSNLINSCPLQLLEQDVSPMHLSHEKWNSTILNMDPIIEKYTSNVPNENVPSFLNNLSTTLKKIDMHGVNHDTFDFSSFHVTSKYTGPECHGLSDNNFIELHH